MSYLFSFSCRLFCKADIILFNKTGKFPYLLLQASYCLL